MSFLRRVLRKERLGAVPKLSEHALVTFLNPYSYLLARKNEEIFKKFDRIYPDGIFLAKAFSFIRLPGQRRSFDMTSLAPTVLAECVQLGIPLAVIGSEPGVVEKAVAIWKSSFGPGLQIVYTRNGFFVCEDERLNCFEQILNSGAQVVIVGMGTPFQEKFLVELRESGWSGIGFTCGGFLHQTASKGEVYYPKWIDDFNLRWLYRMYDEPKLIKRYFFNYPIFLFAFFADFVSRR